MIGLSKVPGHATAARHDFFSRRSSGNRYDVHAVNAAQSSFGLVLGVSLGYENVKSQGMLEEF